MVNATSEPKTTRKSQLAAVAGDRNARNVAASIGSISAASASSTSPPSRQQMPLTSTGA